MSEAKLFGSLQRIIGMWRAGEIDAVAEQHMRAKARWADVRKVGGQPEVVAAAVWARELNADLAARYRPAEIFGRFVEE